MLCIKNDEIQEGTEIDIDFSLVDKDGDPVTPTENKYKLSDGIEILKDWTNAPLSSDDTVTIEGDLNRVLKPGRTERFFTLFFKYGTSSQASKTIQYDIIDSPNIDSDTPS